MWIVNNPVDKPVEVFVGLAYPQFSAWQAVIKTVIFHTENEVFIGT